MKIQTGDILLVLEGQYKLADLIMRVTNSKAHHVGVFRDPDTVSEMEAEGHILTPWDSLKYNSGNPHDRTLILMRYKRPLPLDEVVAFIDSNTAKYDYLALLKHLFYRRFGWWLGRRSAKAAKRMTCSEWVAFLYHTFTGLWRIWYKAAPVNIKADHRDEFFYYAFVGGELKEIV